MFKQVDQQDLALFVKLADEKRPETRADVPTHVLIPAFLISELKTAFQIGFLIFLPFLVIDLVVSTTLMSMGMMMLPPILISLPFKLLLFVLVDGWNLVTQSLVQSFN
jgi:flagellar biosynthetic protein FliP